MTAVIWGEFALDQLADIYVAVDPPTREAVAAAVTQANRELEDDPRSQGESREGGSRVAFFGRLTVFFTPADGDEPTRVYEVLWRGRRPAG